MLLLVGTYSRSGPFGPGQAPRAMGRGIHVFRLTAETGTLEELPPNVGIDNPSYLCFSPDRRFAYCVNEIGDFAGGESGSVSAFRIEGDEGRLVPLGSVSSHGLDPCHLMTDRTGRTLYAANYSSGSVCVLPIGDDGALDEAVQVVQHEGSSVNKARQEGPHAHGLEMTADNRVLYVCDLGIDRVMIYERDGPSGKLTPHEAQPFVETAPGAGPRHITLHPDGRSAYLINELDSTVTAFACGEDGSLTALGTHSTLPPGFDGTSTTAEIQVSPDGRFLYGSNRGHDSLAIFAINPADGSIEPVGHESTGGEVPRHFEIDPSGAFLAAANQVSGNIMLFRRDSETGALAATGEMVELGAPVCARFF